MSEDEKSNDSKFSIDAPPLFFGVWVFCIFFFFFFLFFEQTQYAIEFGLIESIQGFLGITLISGILVFCLLLVSIVDLNRNALPMVKIWVAYMFLFTLVCVGLFAYSVNPNRTSISNQEQKDKESTKTQRETYNEKTNVNNEAETEEAKTYNPVNNQANNSNKNSNIAYNYGLIQEWEGARADDLARLDNWESEIDYEWYDKEVMAGGIRKYKDRIGITNKIIDGITNSSITQSELDRLVDEYNSLGEEISKIFRKVRDGGYDKCIETWEELEELTGKDYSDELDNCEKYLDI